MTHRLKDDRLLQDVETVLKRLQTVESEMMTVDDRTYLMRVLPYRTTEDHIQGVVITFVEITRSKKAEIKLRIMV
jgi:two-component system CheB/CheR fusion protein